MDSDDVQIGERLQALRGPVISQAGLANAMKERGHDKWSQATVWSVEQGKRPLRLTEAAALAEILQAEVGDLLQSSEASKTMDRIRDALVEVDRIGREIGSLVLDFEEARTALRDEIAHIDQEAIGSWTEAERERLHRLLVDADHRMKWHGEHLEVMGRGDMEDEWLHDFGGDDDGVDQ